MYAAALWQRLAPMLAGLGLLTEGDIDALSLLCQQHSIYRQCADMIRKEGIIVSHKNKAGAVNRVPHPALRVQHAAIQNIVKISARFGLTPSDRNGLGLAGEEPKDELDALAQA
jgi:P27 family predicted phage terminase small subunit